MVLGCSTVRLGTGSRTGITVYSLLLAQRTLAGWGGRFQLRFQAPAWSKVHTEQNQTLVPQRSWFQHDGHQHGVQFYSADKFLIEELSRYVNHALHAGDAAVVVATEEHRESLIRQLSAQGVEIATAIEQGRFLALDAAQMLATFMIEGWPDQQRFNGVVGGVIEKAVAATDRGANPRVAIYGEMVALLWEQGKVEAAIRLEQLWNDLARSKSFSLFCGYPISSFGHERDADLLMKVCGEHSAVVPAEGYTGLVNEDDRRRTVVQLQQKAKALETEVAEHKRLRQELELRVQSRTAELQSNIPGVPKEYGLRASVFVDAGSVFGYGGPTTFPGSAQSLQVAGKSIVRSSVGAGLTWASPFGALTVNYAVPLSKAAYDVVQPLSFTAGGF